MTNADDTQRLPGQRQSASPSEPSPTPFGQMYGEQYKPKEKPRGVRRWLRNALLTVAVLAISSLFLIAGFVLWEARNDEARDVDAIVVLGAAQYNGRPSAVLQARLDRAFELYEAGHAPTIVVTGGRQEGDAFTEAEASANYLIHQGVPVDAILYEDVGRDTWGSLQAVDEVLKDTEIRELLLVSDGFHLLRTELMARNLGYTADSSPATESPIEPWTPAEFSHVIRETGAILAFVPRML